MGAPGPKALQHRERQRDIERARQALLRAAAALTEPATHQVLAFALVEAATGLLCIARADVDEAGRALAEARLRDLMRPP